MLCNSLLSLFWIFFYKPIPKLNRRIKSLPVLQKNTTSDSRSKKPFITVTIQSWLNETGQPGWAGLSFSTEIWGIRINSVKIWFAITRKIFSPFYRDFSNNCPGSKETGLKIFHVIGLSGWLGRIRVAGMHNSIFFFCLLWKVLKNKIWKLENPDKMLLLWL